MERSPAVWLRDARQYLLDVRTEFRKITWPTQQEYVGGTIGVMVIVAFLTLVLGVVDLGLNKIMQLLLG